METTKSPQVTMEGLRNAGFVVVQMPGVASVQVKMGSRTVALWKPNSDGSKGVLTVLNPQYAERLAAVDQSELA